MSRTTKMFTADSSPRNWNAQSVHNVSMGTTKYDDGHHVVTEKKVSYFTVSSRDRDITVYPDVNRYSVHLPRDYREIHSIELIQGIIPDANNVTREPYLVVVCR